MPDAGLRAGYTPLHMAAGYLHTSTVAALLEGGADPEQLDRQGRSPLELVEGLRVALPPGNPATAQRRVALEDVLKVLTDNVFEDVEPAAVLGARDAPADAGKKAAAPEAEREFLVRGPLASRPARGRDVQALNSRPPPATPQVRFADDPDPVWVPARYVSPEVVQDFEGGLEYAEAAEVVDVRNRGDSRAYLVRWGDGAPDSWEPEEHVSGDLVAAFEAGRAAVAG
jgi:signal recognition particle protein